LGSGAQTFFLVPDATTDILGFTADMENLAQDIIHQAPPGQGGLKQIGPDECGHRPAAVAA